MPISDFISTLQDNPYFSAGFGLFGIGAGVAALRKASVYGLIFFRRHYLTTLEVTIRDRSYEWLLQFINTKATNTQHVSVKTSFEENDAGKFLSSFKFHPSVGTHYISYKNAWIKVDRTREQIMDINSGIPLETLRLTAFGNRKTLFSEMLFEAKDLALLQEGGQTIIYTAMGSDWRKFGNPRKHRPIDTVILDEGISDRILKDVKEFINSSSWYAKRGIPYRRGYLLYGPPGSGKSSFITALAAELQYCICILNLSDNYLTDDRLQYLMNVVPQESIILLEDVDAAFVSRENDSDGQAAYNGMNNLTFSGLLNMLDGVVSAEARIMFMTTNYMERLDSALIRPGRVDIKEYIGHATPYQLKRMYEKFFPEEKNLANNFADKVAMLNRNVSMADAQGLFMLYKNDPKGIIENAGKIGKL